MPAHLGHEGLEGRVDLLEVGFELVALVRVRVEASDLYEEDVALGAERYVRVDDLGHLRELAAEIVCRARRGKVSLGDVGGVELRCELAILDERLAERLRDGLAEDGARLGRGDVDEVAAELVEEGELGHRGHPRLGRRLRDNVGHHRAVLEDLLVALDRVDAHRVRLGIARRERLCNPPQDAVGSEALRVHVLRADLLRVVCKE
mmetsp:Transcript_57129/g.137346  ORF Transcript_57129/g.137346 Transcript_57129/m.137346 type:complete len:205 (+) Transcript_57129:894-1508(+)